MYFNCVILCILIVFFYVQGGSNMTGTDLCVNKPHMSRSYLNHLVFCVVLCILCCSMYFVLFYVFCVVLCILIVLFYVF